VFVINEDIVDKVSVESEIRKEYQNISNLPQPGPYYNLNDIDIIPLSEKDIDYVFNECPRLRKLNEELLAENEDETLYELRLPHILKEKL